MVSAKSRAAQGSLLALLAVQHAAATSLELNPVTPDVRVLDRRNPAFGGRPAVDMVKPIVFEDPTMSKEEVYQDVAVNGTEDAGNATVSGIPGLPGRKLEVTSADIEKLEEHFKQPMIVNLNTIKSLYNKSEFKPAPWPSSYWPTYQDSINAKWDGTNASPAEKYAKAFGMDTKSFMDAVSAYNGIDSLKDYTPCTSQTTCSRLGDGSACAKRAGMTKGYCIPTWYGICHAWAPASILEAEPRCNVVKNGVTFKPFDIKALLTAIYDGTYVPVVFTGARYNGGDDTRDEYGRYNDATERDLGPGFFHVAVTNIMGRFQKSFVVDVNADAQVWNQPVRSYTIKETTLMTPAAAAKTYFRVPKYPFNDNAVSVAYVRMTFSYINEYIQDGPLVSTGVVDRATASRDYTYLLELDAAQNIIGGEWVGNSQTDHPDFLWFATDKPQPDAVTSVGISYKNIAEILQQSVACGAAPTPAPTTPAPTTPKPTTPAPTTPKPTTPAPTTPRPTTPAPTTPRPTTPAPTTPAPTTPKPITPAPTTPAPTTPKPTTPTPTTPATTTPVPTTPKPTTPAPTTPAPTTPAPTTPAPTTPAPTTPAPTTPAPTTPTTPALTTPAPTTPAPTTPAPTTPAPTTPAPTTPAPTTSAPTTPAPTTPAPTTPAPTTPAPTTPAPTTPAPTTPAPTTPAPTTPAPTTPAPTTSAPTTPAPTTPAPTTPAPTTPAPTTPAPTTPAPTTPKPTTPAPTTQAPASGQWCGNQQVGTQACPAGEYCQPWDPSYYQCRKLPAVCGIQEVGVDYYGDDIATVQLLLPEQCCEMCTTTAGCKAYTFVNYNPDGKAYCYLKKGTGQKSNKVGVVSATIVPTPATCTTPAWGSCGNAAAGFSCCPSGFYCQPWDSNNYQCMQSPAKCSQQFPNTDFYGDDIATVYGVNAGECCDKCAATAGCKAYTFVNDNVSNNVATSACYLKKSTGVLKTNSHAVSALLN